MLAGLRSLLSDRRLLAVLALILFYRASEVHMARIIPVFATKTTAGGLGLSNETYAVLRMMSAVGGLALGGVIGSLVVARLGLARALLPLGITMHLPLVAFAWLAYDGSHNLWIIGSVFIVEYIVYGAGLCALILAMMKLASGPGAPCATPRSLPSPCSLITYQDSGRATWPSVSATPNTSCSHSASPYPAFFRPGLRSGTSRTPDHSFGRTMSSCSN